MRNSILQVSQAKKRTFVEFALGSGKTHKQTFRVASPNPTISRLSFLDNLEHHAAADEGSDRREGYTEVQQLQWA